MKSFFKKVIHKFKDIFFDGYLILIICSLFFLGQLIHINILGIKYLIPIFIGFLLLLLFNFFVLCSKRLKKKIKIFFFVLAVILSGILVFGGIALHNIFTSVQEIFSNNSTIHYSVYVLKDSSYKEIDDLDGKIIGFYTEDKYSEASKEKLSEEVDVDYVGYSTLEELTEALMEEDIDSLLLMDSYLDVLRDEDQDNENIDSILESEFEEKSKVIFQFELSIDNASESKTIDIENGAFAIYVSGQDSFANSVSDTSRSDVNLLMVVNLKTKQILLLSIPRDYYVPISGKGAYDKLTHISLYGSETAANTIGEMLDVEVDYFVKFNFTTFMKAITYFLPLDVYSDYTFTTSVYDQTIGTSYNFKEGFNHITTGEMALQFVRARKNFAEGDRQRGINQSRMLRAVIHKASSPAVLLKYNEILNSLDGTFLTNISNESIIEIFKYLINHSGTFEISSFSLDGYDASRTCYSSGSTPLYVMIPNSKTISEASEYIQAVLNGEKPNIEIDASELADSSDTHEVTKSSYKEIYIPPAPVKVPEKEENVFHDEDTTENPADDENGENSTNTTEDPNPDDTGENNGENSGENSGEDTGRETGENQDDSSNSDNNDHSDDGNEEPIDSQNTNLDDDSILQDNH